MNLMHGKTKYLARLMLALVLFAQGTLAAHACVTPSDNMMQMLAGEVVGSSMPCHEVEKPNLNACQMHCTLSEQLNMDQQTPLAIAVSPIVLSVAIVATDIDFISYNSQPVALNSGPPISIRFCTFLI